MRIFNNLHLIFVVILIKSWTVSTELVISPLDEGTSKDLFSKIRNANPSSFDTSKEDEQTRAKVCSDVLKKILPSSSNVDVVRFENLYSKNDSQVNALSKIPGKYYVGHYEWREITSNGETGHEMVYACKLENKALKNQAYFISPEYELWKKRVNHFRIVYRRMDGNQSHSLSPVAVAEKPSALCNRTEGGDLMKGKAICKLPAFFKIRLCNLILSSEEYRKQGVHYDAFQSSGEPRCVVSKFHVSDRPQPVTRRWDPVEPKKWALRCEAVQNKRFGFGSDASIHHIVALSSAFDKFLVFPESRNCEL